jgi:phosphohistidine phosphatase
MSTTTLYLIRHGIAAERGTYADDRDRPLTAKGRDRTERVAQRLSQLGIGFDLLLSSPLVRAYETAEILVYQGLAPYFTRHDALAPGGDLADWLTWLGDWQVNQPESAPWRSSVTSRT